MKWATMIIPRVSHLSSLHLVELCLPPTFPAHLQSLSSLCQLVIRGCCLAANTSFDQCHYLITRLHIEGLCWHDHTSRSFELIRTCPEVEHLKLDWFCYLYDENPCLPVNLTSLVVLPPLLSSSECVSRSALSMLGHCLSSLSTISTFLVEGTSPPVVDVDYSKTLLPPSLTKFVGPSTFLSLAGPCHVGLREVALTDDDLSLSYIMSMLPLLPDTRSFRAHVNELASFLCERERKEFNGHSNQPI
ncbi:hypothetical protein C8R41DRAFT_927295 [Lentinula lateritia]|uniref:F-box domain-containing protein n=1 Tax=Lentinula lateritia TaxID=40482 RepID=A0ABQ8UXL3_9AGAR|nr:hypothetical protein C8R41DRAFT_927295 [Lentinula lateritia]